MFVPFSSNMRSSLLMERAKRCGNACQRHAVLFVALRWLLCWNPAKRAVDGAGIAPPAALRAERRKRLKVV